MNSANCLWVVDGDIKRCSRPGCTNQIKTDLPSHLCFAICEALPSEVQAARIIPIHVGGCCHFGSEIRRISCPTCSGNVKVKVFACSLHKECTVHKQLENIACCLTCQDYVQIT